MSYEHMPGEWNSPSEPEKAPQGLPDPLPQRLMALLTFSQEISNPWGADSAGATSYVKLHPCLP